jgi:hypothetical protein
MVRTYRKLKIRLDSAKADHARGQWSGIGYVLTAVGLRIAIQLMVLPYFLLLGPFQTFTQFARTDESGSWIDSYNDFIVSNRITIGGIVSIVLIAVIAILTFIYLPIFYV